jgi:hypothetical protein
VVSALLIGAILALVLVIRYYHDRVGKLQADIEENGAARRKLAVAQARILDQWAPILARHPLDPRSFRFVGGAFDGIQILDDRVVFVEFVGGGRPAGDPRVRDMVRSGRVDWLEVSLEPQAPAAAPAEPSAPEPSPFVESPSQEGLS